MRIGKRMNYCTEVAVERQKVMIWTAPQGWKSLYNPPPLPLPLLFFFSSLALFAFWLRYVYHLSTTRCRMLMVSRRSSVVSVLFSLISESVLRDTIVIKSIFETRTLASELAHASAHCVTGLTLPPVDANTLFTAALACPGLQGKEIWCDYVCLQAVLRGVAKILAGLMLLHRIIQVTMLRCYHDASVCEQVAALSSS